MIGNLTTREVELCRELVKGKSRKEIARSMGTGEDSVRILMNKMICKFPCRPNRLPRIEIARTLMEAAQQYPLIAEALEL